MFWILSGSLSALPWETMTKTNVLDQWHNFPTLCAGQRWHEWFHERHTALRHLFSTVHTLSEYNSLCCH